MIYFFTHAIFINSLLTAYYNKQVQHLLKQLNNYRQIYQGHTQQNLKITRLRKNIIDAEILVERLMSQFYRIYTILRSIQFLQFLPAAHFLWESTYETFNGIKVIELGPIHYSDLVASEANFRRLWNITLELKMTRSEIDKRKLLVRRLRSNQKTATNQI